MTDRPRLIEVAFPLEQASLDSVHEKNVRHGHISTLHIWPARRPLAACRAALIATLLPDPGNAAERLELLERLAGHVVTRVRRKRMPNGRLEEVEVRETEGGILHWGRETENAETLAWFREKIRKAYGGRAPRVLDPFAGGGAIPLEAMRLGCEVTAMDINPVAWFLLKCTLDYPQKLAGQTRPLPEFAARDREFMEGFLRSKGLKGQRLYAHLEKLGLGEDAARELPGLGGESPELEADLAWHVRAWGKWVLDRARRDLARYYPTFAEWEPLQRQGTTWERRALRAHPLRDDGTPEAGGLNADLAPDHLSDPRSPRWVVKPTVAYLWARTVTCKNCRATVPLLKTRWLCRKDRKRVLLTLEPNEDATRIVFGVDPDVPVVGSNAAQRREHDRRLGVGTMSRSGATCPLCRTIQTPEDLRAAGQAKAIGAVLTAVVTEGPAGKEYRLPEGVESNLGSEAALPQGLDFGLPEEAVPEGASRVGGGSPFTVHLYGLTRWRDLFTPRQLCALAAIVGHTRCAAEALAAAGCPGAWREAVVANLAVSTDKLADYMGGLCTWHMGREIIRNVFGRFALPINWDIAEVNPLSGSTGNYLACLDWVARVCDHTVLASRDAPQPQVTRQSAIALQGGGVDVIVTDPPYYDAIPYADLMDFFYVWLRRTLRGLSPEIDQAFHTLLSPKWDHAANDGELIDDSSRFGGDRTKSKAVYEDGMFRAFEACRRALNPDGRLVIVFAHKHPDAWETLVSAIIRAGFVVDASWPIRTEMGNRTRALASAALSSSIWLVCKKRPETARPGWDEPVLREMREKITLRLRDFWDAGIRGPDFVWAATGPALEAYSRHPVVRKATTPGAPPLAVAEFLGQVRRMVVDFVVGAVMAGAGTQEVSGLDDATTYYLLHRHDFGLEDVPSGACILYALSCGLSDGALVDQYDLLLRTGGNERAAKEDAEETERREGEEEEGESEEERGTGASVRLKSWERRLRKGMGYEESTGRPVPLIDQIHRLMHLWRTGDVTEVDDFLEARGLRGNTLFHQVLQALIELAPVGSDERSLLERISNHLGLRPARAESQQRMDYREGTADERG